MSEVESANDSAELGGKYLTFFLDREEYGLEILKVREIIGMMDITPFRAHLSLSVALSICAEKSHLWSTCARNSAWKP